MANHLYMPTTDVSPAEHMTLMQYMVNEIRNVRKQGGKVVATDDKKLEGYGEMKNSMMSTFMLLEIFQRTENKIAGSIKISNHSQCTRQR